MKTKKNAEDVMLNDTKKAVILKYIEQNKSAEEIK